LEISCIYCPNESFEKGKGSLEHVILSSLGGRKSSRNICCESCNNRLGKEIDESLGEGLSFFSTMLDITTGRNKPAPTQKMIAEHKGKEFDIHSGGLIKFSKNDVEINEADGKAEISISANSEEEVLKILSGVLKKYDKTIDDFTDLEAKSVKSYVPSIRQRIYLGGEEQLRSIAKTALTYLATFVAPERLRTGDFQSVIQYINEKGTENNFVSFSTAPFPLLDQVDPEIKHRLIVAASDENKKANAVLELYGNIRFFITLTDQWSGPSISKLYTIDPVTKQSEEAESSHSEEIFNLSHEDSVDNEGFKRAIGNVIQCFQDRQMNEIISQITNKTIEKHMVGKGDYITEEMLSSVASEVALEFTRVMHRIDTEEAIDLVELNKKRQSDA
jgi:hypothetical protein